MKAAFVLAIITLPIPALADIPRCDRLLMAHHVGEKETRDLGGGIVSHVEWTSIYHDGFGGDYSQLVLSACRIGANVTVGLSSSTGPYNVRDEIMARFEQIIESEESFTLRQVADDLAQISPQVEYHESQTDQPCGCAVAYPFSGNYETKFDRSELG